MADITAAQGRLIVLEAMSWADTPYSLVGNGSIKGQGGDCSGSTWRIYTAAGFAYDYRSTGAFASYAATSGLFRKLRDNEARQDGDILLWSEHMAIFSTFTSPLEAPLRTTPRVNRNHRPWTQVNDMWTAHYTGGPAYGTGASQNFSATETPDVYRWTGPTPAAAPAR